MKRRSKAPQAFFSVYTLEILCLCVLSLSLSFSVGEILYFDALVFLCRNRSERNDDWDLG